MSELAFRTATELIRDLQSGKLKSRDVLEYFVDRVERLNGPLNAVVTTNLEAARARADQIDAAGASQGPLHGLPMTIKDSIEVVGMPTTSGAPELAKHMPARNADSVQRLVDAGVVIFGKTNLPLFAGDFQSYNEVYGTTNNPWDVSKGPGGSSGGAAAALAAGFTPLELGSDIGGSIRNPAHYCGLYGHKPSYGIVSLRGHIPGPPGQLAASDLAVLGPLARAPEDLELALDVLTAPQPAEATAWSVKLPPARHEQLRDYRVAVWIDDGQVPLDREMADLLHKAAEAIAAAGPHVKSDARPSFDPSDSLAVSRRLLYGVMGAGFPPAVQKGFDDALASLTAEDSSDTAQMIRGTSGRHRDWLVDDEMRAHLRARWAEFFQDFDVLLCPVQPTPAFPHDHSPLPQRTIEINGERVGYLDQGVWAGLITVAYLPSTVVPVGRTASGLPVGMQVVAPYLEDRTSLRFAKLIQDVTGGFTAPPDYAV